MSARQRVRRRDAAGELARGDGLARQDHTSHRGEPQALTSEAYNDVGELIAEGYIPYFDVVVPGADVLEATGRVPDDGVSHWLNPTYINDESAKPDPWGPESILMDNKWWKPIGPMYIATDHGDPVWDTRELWGYKTTQDYGNQEAGENDRETCSPWHAHDGVPVRFAWWYYRQVHEADYATAEKENITLSCVTACMMHAWIYPTADGLHSGTAGAPDEHGPGGPPNRPGYPTPAVPGEADLSMEVLPDEVQERAMPDWLAAELAVVGSLSRERVMTTTLAELESIVASRSSSTSSQLAPSASTF